MGVQKVVHMGVQNRVQKKVHMGSRWGPEGVQMVSSKGSRLGVHILNQPIPKVIFDI